MSPEQAVVRGEHARHILEDELFKEAMQTLEKDIFEAWRQTPIRDVEGQQKLLLMIQTARKFRAIFETLIQSGEIAKNDLKPSRLTRTLERFGVYD